MVHHRRAPSVHTKRLGDLHLHFAELWDGCRRYLATELDCEHLSAITDTQDDPVLYQGSQITIRNGGGMLVGHAFITP